MYLRQNPADNNLTEQELTRIVHENGDKFHDMLKRMSKYNGNITGSSAYFLENVLNWKL